MRTAIVLSILLIATSGHADTWRVAQDGSGDFVTIQAAVDAAADGDSISIAPGRYVDATLFESDSSNTELAHVGIAKNGISMIGDSRDEVIIGPMEYTPHSWGIAMRADEASDLSISHLTLVNVREGVRAFGSFRVQDVQFEDCYLGVVAHHEAGGWILDSQFRRMRDRGILYFLDVGSTELLTVQRCEFIDSSGIYQSNYGQIHIFECTFLGGVVGFHHGGSLAVVRECTFEDVRNVAIAAGGGLLLVENNDIHGASVALATGYDTEGVIRNNVIRGGSLAAIYVYRGWDVVVSDNRIHRGSGHAIEVDYGTPDAPTVTIDLTENWWGSTDPGEISEWIWDGNDDPTIKGFVEFEPVLGELVPTETLSFGELKAAY